MNKIILKKTRWNVILKREFKKWVHFLEEMKFLLMLEKLMQLKNLNFQKRILGIAFKFKFPSVSVQVHRKNIPVYKNE